MLSFLFCQSLLKIEVTYYIDRDSCLVRPQLSTPYYRDRLRLAIPCFESLPSTAFDSSQFPYNIISLFVIQPALFRLVKSVFERVSVHASNTLFVLFCLPVFGRGTGRRCRCR